MDWFKTINLFYPIYWTKEMVADAVELEKITPEQYEEITGIKYAA
jgi:uncharacterized XkdX family phage protein